MSAESHILIKTFKDEPFVLGIQLGRDEIKYLIDIQFLSDIMVVTGYVFLIKIDNIPLFFYHVLNIVGIYISLDRSRHTSNYDVQMK